MRAAITLQTALSPTSGRTDPLGSRGESLGSRIVRLASEARQAPKPREPRRGEHEYVRDRAKALAVIRDHIEVRGEFARKLGRPAGDVIGFNIVRARGVAQPERVRIGGGGGGDWADATRASELPERPTKRRGRPGRRGKLVAALARSRTF